MSSPSVQIEIKGASAVQHDRPTPDVHSHGPRLEVVVLVTDVPSTLAALRTATQLASGLRGRIRLLAVQHVPYPLPLDEPSVNVPFLRERIYAILEGCAADTSDSRVETVADVFLSRDACQTLSALLAPQSVVVIGKRSRWWPKPEDRLAPQLRKLGHNVVRTGYRKEVVYA